MQCPECLSNVREGVKFCEECGVKLEAKCPECKNTIPLGTKFCGECGHRLVRQPGVTKTIRSIESERKHVTVLFSDLSGYTAMTERLDPEEAKDILNRIFGEIAQVIAKYEGFIEKFIGDAVMAIFGIPKAHEDDPVRAIKAAIEIHKLVDGMNPSLEGKVGQALSMHSGINTGLVVTGEINLEQGTHGLTGDTINTASRLHSLAKTGEILVGHETYRQSEGFYDFESLGTVEVKGKKGPVNAYKLSSKKDKPITVHRLHGVRAELIGRNLEIEELCQAVDKLRDKKGAIFSVCGAAGTGKSRLIDEFKAKIDLSSVQWLEGCAYPYTMNTPYFPLINLLNRALQIDEEDSRETVEHKIKNTIDSIVTDSTGILPYIGSLYSIPYSEVEKMSPENWKINLHDAVLTILSTLARQKPTIIFLEDLHWADSSFIELIRYILLESNDPIVFVCAYRPQISLFAAYQTKDLSQPYKEFHLRDLSPSESQIMVKSLLKADSVPSELKQFVHEKVQGNPFYLEEVVNSLIETQILIEKNQEWAITQPITEQVISSTIHGVIASRMDRLEHETKRILQEASVIGTAFYYQILKKISLAKENIDQNLSILERLDLIRMKALEPDLEYIFKHGLTQEVVYNGILKKERKIIHEQIGEVIEQIFKDRLPEFHDALAFHFKRGQSRSKAVHYLMISGEKSLKRYSVEESNKYYEEAYEILTDNEVANKEKNIIVLLIKWALTLYYLGAFGKIKQLFETHKSEAEAFGDQSLLGMFYVWLGVGLFGREQSMEADQYLSKALEIGKTIDDKQVVAYALTWLCWTRVDLGKLDEIKPIAQNARKLSEAVIKDDYPYYKSSGGEGLACFMAGDSLRNKELGELLLSFGDTKSHIRALVLGYVSIAFSSDCAGDFSLAIKNYRRAISVAKDPMYEQYTRIFLAMALLQNNKIKEAEEAFEDVVQFCEKQGFESVGSPARFYLGIIQIINGQMSSGMKQAEDVLSYWIKIDRKPVLGIAFLSLGKLYAQIASGSESISIKMMLKNLGFIIKNVPGAMKKAEEYLFKAIEHTDSINASALKAQAFLELGLLYKRKGIEKKAIKYLKDAVEIFNDYGTYVYLERAQSALNSIEKISMASVE